MPPPTQALNMTSIDDRMVAAMRLFLAFSALLIIYIDPTKPDRYVALTHTTLVLYLAYSATLLALAWRCSTHPLFNVTHWLDASWNLVLIGLTGGTKSSFFLYFFFAILAASFRRGFVEGLVVTIASAVSFSIVGVATTYPQPVELYIFLLRLVCLLALGYMISYWGGSETALKRKLGLLSEIANISNPRLGVNQTVSAILERLRVFYDAEKGMLVMADESQVEHSGHTLYCANRSDSRKARSIEPISNELARVLLTLPSHHAVVYRPWEWIANTNCYVYDIATGKQVRDVQDISEPLVTMLEAVSFITVPLHRFHKPIGRLYLVAARPYSFGVSDIRFLLQVVEHIMPILDNLRLVDQLASRAAEHERRKIALDLHDNMLQPFIGFQVGLAAVRQKLTTGNADVMGDIERLIKMTESAITDLRQHMFEVRGGDEYDNSLVEAVRRFSAKFAESYDITVHIEAGDEPHLNDRLAAEVFQMVVEGLSNVWRHTQAEHATVKTSCSNGQLNLEIENDGAAGSPRTFTPRSLTERAAALGGHVSVEQRGKDRTGVVITIPL